MNWSKYLENLPFSLSQIPDIPEARKGVWVIKYREDTIYKHIVLTVNKVK